MDILTLTHQGILFAHVIAFAIAFSAVVREDIALFSARSIDLERLAGTARTLTAALLALWATGLALLVFEVGLDPRVWASSPKPAAKLLVVAALSANGVALHALAFPMLRADGRPSSGRVVIPVILGAVSTASWLCASFIGVSRLVAPAMRFADFMLIYGVLLAGAVGSALVFVRPRVAHLLHAARQSRSSPAVRAGSLQA